MTEYVIAGIVSSVIAFFTVYFTTPTLIKLLQTRNLVVKDVNKKGQPMIPRPGGPAIIAGLLASEFFLYLFFQMNEILAIMITTFAAFLVGYVDDMGKRSIITHGLYKPLALAVAAVPIILFGAYDSDLTFPIFGSVQIPIMYIGLIVLMIPITGNTINSIDVLNGVASGFMTIASFSLTIALFVIQNYEIAVVSLPLGFVSLAFYKYHKIPSRIFPGDSGALTLGAMYGSIAIVGGVEIIAGVALLPAVINSFLFLSSVKKVVEHREVKAKPVDHTDDLKLRATADKNAPVTLVRLIVSSGPLSEKQIGKEIFKLVTFSGILAIITAFLTVLLP